MPLIDRTNFNAIVDSNGTPGHGSVWDKALIQAAILDPADTAYGSSGLSSGSNYINETSNAFMTVGLTINQGANDNETLTFKSSDVAHGMSAETENDTYATIKKGSPTLGGLELSGFTDGGSRGITYRSCAENADTTKSGAAVAGHNFYSYARSGTGIGAPGANTNIAVFSDQSTTRFILDADGDSHQDVGTAWTNFDTHDDVSVLNLLTAYVTRPEDPLRDTFAHWLLQSRDTLERLRLVTFNDDGHHFVNMSRLTMLLVGAVRQLGHRLDRIEQRMRALEA